MRLLAVDDDESALELLRGALSDSGYNNHVAVTSGAEALDILNKPHASFDVFLLDIQMPGIDGIALCEQIRAMPRYRNAPVVMITAMSERHYIEGAFAAGAMDYVNKPFDPMELGVRIGMAEKLVEQARLATEARSEVDRLKSSGTQVMNFDVADPVAIEDVPRVLSYLAMENYLLRLTRRMIGQSEAVAFRIDSFDLLFSRATPTEIYDILSDTAEAIVSGLKREHHLVTYCGNGAFVAVMHKQSGIHDPDILVTVQALLDRIQPCYSDGSPCPVSLRMGEIHAPRAWIAGNPLKLLTVPLKSVLSDKDNGVPFEREVA